MYVRLYTYYREVGVSALREWAAERDITVHVSSLGKAKTASQLVALTALLACRLDTHAHMQLMTAGNLLLIASAVLAVVSAMEYCRGVLDATKPSAVS